MGPRHVVVVSTFAAIDFETANYAPESACAVGVVRVVDGRVIARQARLIRPPTRDFVFTSVHGITWKDVAWQPSFRDVWRDLRHLCEGVAFIAAHNATFDDGVLRACCARAGVTAPRAPVACTVAIARKVWGIYPTRLNVVAARLGIDLLHHDAMSDANACAQIVIRAQERRWSHDAD